jgi:hypothetical protein
MILTVTHKDDGLRRLYCGRGMSIVAVFDETEEGGNTVRCEPGFACYPDVFSRDAPAVLAYAIDEVARRLGIASSSIATCRFDELARVADPDLPPEYCYARRSNRAYPRRFR